MGKLTIALVLCVAAVYIQADAPGKLSEGIRRQLLVPGAAPQVSIILIKQLFYYLIFLLILKINYKLQQ